MTPDEIRTKVTTPLSSFYLYEPKPLVGEIVNLMEQAVKAETERCAGIAANYYGMSSGSLAAHDLGRRIAKAIRSQP